MFKLSDTPSKEEYKAHSDKTVLLGTQEVTIILDRVQTKSGSWERGFKFGDITYGLLRRFVPGRHSFTHHEYSADHGKSWHPDIRTAKKAKGKTIVERSTPRGEFAFNSIQKINRDYYGSDYKWKP